MTLTERTHDLDDDRDGPIRIGVLSDTHGEICEHVMAQLQGSEIILHAGDVCGQDVLDQLAEITPKVIAVSGNNDPRFTYTENALPDLVHVQVPGGKISLLHGHQFGIHTPSHAAMREAFPSSRAIIYGHSHRQVHDHDSAPELINPGAAGSTRTNGGASCVILVARSEQDWEISLHRST